LRASLEQERGELERSRAAQVDLIDSLTRATESLRDAVTAADRELHEATISLDAERRSASMVDRERERLRKEQERLATEEHVAITDLEAIARERTTAEARLADLVAVHDQQSARVKTVRAEKPEEADARDFLRSARARLAAEVGRHERARARLEELENERLRLLQEISQELGVSVSALPAPLETPPPEDEIRRLRARVLQYAELDASVVQEHEETKERYEYLTSQIADLRAAADGLREIMAIADAEMQTRFQSALAAVTDELSHVFRVMLRGGEARLEQVDAEGGIEVRATLPGKRVRSSAAFSGGERALVATSILFAVLRTRPTPFCVLDEVDAALDETNVDRYLGALREITERTQVIVVTHNRATMAAANALYGLTMDGDGASSVLSVRLDQYEAAG
jgi:chromosome segregation protein